MVTYHGRQQEDAYCVLCTSVAVGCYSDGPDVVGLDSNERRRSAVPCNSEKARWRVLVIARNHPCKVPLEVQGRFLA